MVKAQGSRKCSGVPNFMPAGTPRQPAEVPLLMLLGSRPGTRLGRSTLARSSPKLPDRERLVPSTTAPIPGGKERGTLKEGGLAASLALDLLSAITSLDSQREPQFYLDPRNPARNRGIAAAKLERQLQTELNLPRCAGDGRNAPGRRARSSGA